MWRGPVYILAGGRSSRFGCDKALALLDGQPLIERLASIVADWGLPVTAVADRRDKYAFLGLRTIIDQVPDRGPIGGLHAALCDLCHVDPGGGECRKALLLLSCDLVDLRQHWIEQLSASLAERPDASACAFQSVDGRWHPMPGLYAETCLPIVQQALSVNDRRHRSMQALLRASGALPVRIPQDWPSLVQVNTRTDLDQASLHLPEARESSRFSDVADTPVRPISRQIGY